ncbi:MAG: hypothetical protein B5M55_06490 [Desulfococcus sp. 4484_242]|nr:MAG: hypothetical protein B5M55_06490 [Desulfococcus sp. 4484_242]
MSYKSSISGFSCRPSALCLSDLRRYEEIYIPVFPFVEIKASLPVLVSGLLFLIAVYTDIRAGVIPNIITFPAIFCGMVFHLRYMGWNEGLFFALKGLVVGGALLIIPFILGGMGGGDLKLLAAVGTWLGGPAVLNVFLYGAIGGAFNALFLMIMKKRRFGFMRVWNDLLHFFITGKRLPPPKEVDGFPYTVPMAIGFLIYIVRGGVI